MKSSLLLGAQTHQDVLQLLLARGALVISGASNETARAMLIARFHELSPRKITVVLPDVQRRDGIQKWLSFFEVPVHTLPKWEEGFTTNTLALYISFSLSPFSEALLLTEEEWERACPSLQELRERKTECVVGQQMEMIAFFEKLIELGYQHGADPPLKPGEYHKTGDTLDIFPVQASTSYKILFSFDTIEAIQCMTPDGAQKGGQPTLSIYPATWKRTAHFRDQLPQGSLLVLDDQEEEHLTQHTPTLLFTAFPEREENHVHLRYLSILKFYTLQDFLNDVRDKLTQGWKLLVVTKRSGELRSILTEEGIPCSPDGTCTPGALAIHDAESGDVLPHSLQNPDLKCALLTDREIFSLRKEGKQRSVQKLALDFITSLQPGDFVVHMDHGIGRFVHVTQKTVDDVTREYLEISYAGTDKLFIPIDQADKLSKFVHEEGAEPTLSRLGSTDWKRTTAKIKTETKKIARELLDLYARRARARGHAYPPDTAEQKRFDEAFPYTETPGQLAAIADIKHDMEDPHPMDRLICGDVGFGKTEVALRAAFKAIQAGKQVAFISPITILADQHFRTLQRRAEGFHVRAEMLSRFRSPREQRGILEKLRKGDLDIVVGTHRLLQDDVKFFNLGLLILDEEQRFGVKQKEKIKSLRASVDIVTLTATPIPRTLNLSLHKLRDITTITTPPPGRLPIITEVRKYSDALVRQAIMSEFQRGGQVYMLHNRVETIDAFADKLRALVPEASFIVSHGQLKSGDLEERVLDFKEGKYDVLVSSTIIENGIDLPRANTLIVNETERFGLAQLYQLRGRVGRGKVQAYAYFLYHTQKLHDDAKKRLRAIVEASELGSGFQIAMRDLEIRGAGEILGVGQSGHMKTVGVSHFLRLLKQTMEEMKTGAAPVELVDENVEINLPIEAFIPGFYIPDEQEKISVYQKLAGSEDEEILREFEEDLREEYGELPRQVASLFRVLRLKMACRRAGVLRVKMEHRDKEKRDIVLTLSPRITAEHIIPLLAQHPQWRVSGSSLRIAEMDLEQEPASRSKKDEGWPAGRPVPRSPSGEVGSPEGEGWFDGLLTSVQAIKVGKGKKERKLTTKNEEPINE